MKLLCCDTCLVMWPSFSLLLPVSYPLELDPDRDNNKMIVIISRTRQWHCTCENYLIHSVPSLILETCHRLWCFHWTLAAAEVTSLRIIWKFFLTFLGWSYIIQENDTKEIFQMILFLFCWFETTKLWPMLVLKKNENCGFNYNNFTWCKLERCMLLFKLSVSIILSENFSEM